MQRADSDRRAAIESIVDSETISTQEELRQRLTERGFNVSQSTLSRDIRRLGLVKRSGVGGQLLYARPAAGETPGSSVLDHLLPELVRDAIPAGQLLVVKTLTGAAQTVAAALDAAGWPEVVGTIAGDDTVLVVLLSDDDARQLATRIERLASRRT